MNGSGNLGKPLMWFMALLLAVFVVGCGGGGGGEAATVPGPSSSSTPVVPGPAGTAGASATDPTVISATPSNGATDVSTSSICMDNVVTGTVLTATFSQPMDPATINSSPAGTLRTFTLRETVSGVDVPGTVAMNAENTVATFTPTAAALTPDTSYTATVTTAARNAAGVAMANTVAWSFTTSPFAFTSQAPVSLGAAGNFAILTKAGVTNVSPSAISGNVGASPITGAAIGLSCLEVSGTIFSVDAVVPQCDDADPAFRVTDPAFLNTAVSAAQTAAADAAGRTSPDVINELGTGEIGGLTLVPGLYKWSTGVSISTDVTLSGGPSDVWIFQISQGLTQATGTAVTLTGGALPKNIVWQSAGVVAIGTNAHFEGVILSGSSITLGNGASVNGRLFAEDNVTLIQNTVTEPAP